MSSKKSRVRQNRRHRRKDKATIFHGIHVQHGFNPDH